MSSDLGQVSRAFAVYNQLYGTAYFSRYSKYLLAKGG